MHIHVLKLALATVLCVLCSPVGAAVPEGLELQQLVSGLDRPVAVRHAGDGSNRLFVVEKPGQIKIIDEQDKLLPTAFLDIRDLVEDNYVEQGLLGLAFDPDFSSNGYFYVNYTYYNPATSNNNKDWTRISRFSVSDSNINIADANSEFVIIEIAQPYVNHDGGDIHFGPDGYLYIAMGDGGSGGDPQNFAQTLSDSGSESLLGKMLRIDVHGTAAEPAGVEKCGEVQNYKIPFSTSDGQIANPWLGDDGVCDEIWTYGWRNPWRFSFDRSTGDIFVGDVGQNAVEEVSWQSADHLGGGNYGWNCLEGSSDYAGPCEGQETMIAPILEYSRSLSGSCAVTGGYVYRGASTAMQGDYIYAEYCGGHIWFAEENGGNWTETLWMNTDYHPSSFGEDESGELYLVHIAEFSDSGRLVADTGAVYRFVDPSVIFSDGFEAQ